MPKNKITRSRERVLFPKFEFFVTENDSIVPICDRIIFDFDPITAEFQFYAKYPSGTIKVFPAKYTND